MGMMIVCMQTTSILYLHLCMLDYWTFKRCHFAGSAMALENVRLVERWPRMFNRLSMYCMLNEEALSRIKTCIVIW